MIGEKSHLLRTELIHLPLKYIVTQFVLVHPLSRQINNGENIAGSKMRNEIPATICKFSSKNVAIAREEKKTGGREAIYAQVIAS